MYVTGGQIFKSSLEVYFQNRNRSSREILIQTSAKTDLKLVHLLLKGIVIIIKAMGKLLGPFFLDRYFVVEQKQKFTFEFALVRPSYH